MFPLQEAINDDLLLAEGSMYDRLHRAAGEHFDPDLAYLGLVYSAAGQTALRSLVGEYVRAAAAAGRRMIIFTPTWRSNVERALRSALAGKDVNRDAVEFMLKARDSSMRRDDPDVYIGGLIGARGDCYQPGEALGASEAAEFHRWQIEKLAAAGVDFLFASTLPALSEARGIARAMSQTSLPYALSFVADGTGMLLDGTPLFEAMRSVDKSVERKPLGYFVNCVHPKVLLTGLKSSGTERRFIGFQGNTSKRDPREFDRLGSLETESPEEFASHSITLAETFGLKVLGGCCGTGPEHISAIAQKLARPVR